MSKRNPIVATTFAAVALVLVSVLGAYGQLQTGEQKCVNAINKDGAAVAKTQGKENVACLKGAGKGTLPGTAQACLTADPKGKVAKSKGKTSADETKSCGAAPSFGYTSAATVNAAAQQASLDLVEDVYGANLDTAVQNCTTQKPGCLCQQKISKTIESLVALKLSTFNGCKKAALKAGAPSSAALVACVNNAGTPGSIAADTKGKIAKARAGLTASIVKTCDGPGVSATVFPGVCTGLTGATLGTCLDTQVECRVCQAINEMDGIFVNCDAFDDGAVNGSCLSGTGPTPTPTPTVTVTPTPQPTSTALFQGAISRTIGLWNYDGVNGLAGGQLECNDHFPGSHVCTFDELLASETAALLTGATDVDALPVNVFWAVIPSADEFDQCVSGVGNILWFYGTGHTASKGLFANLNNGTGDLGPVSGPVSCTGPASNSVGCCE